MSVSGLQNNLRQADGQLQSLSPSGIVGTSAPAFRLDDAPEKDIPIIGGLWKAGLFYNFRYHSANAERLTAISNLSYCKEAMNYYKLLNTLISGALCISVKNAFNFLLLVFS
jgi:hypothetical protein